MKGFAGRSLCALAVLCLSTPFSSVAGKPEHLKMVGEVVATAGYNSRAGSSDMYGMSYLFPSDYDNNAVHQDLNAKGNIGATVMARDFGLKAGFDFKNIRLGAALNADAFINTAGTTGFLLKQTYVASEFLFRCGTLGLLFGQDWHPLAEERPTVAGLDCGMPFNAYSVAPQMKAWYEFPFGLKIEASALWQSYFPSFGPEGRTVRYIGYGSVPELYLGLHYNGAGLHLHAGASYLTMKPRLNGIYPYTDVIVRVNDKVLSFCGFLYADYRHDRMRITSKVTYNDGTNHLGLFGGYAMSGFEPGFLSRTYTNFRTLAAWVDASYGGKLKGSLFLGYSHNFGTVAESFSENMIYCAYNTVNLIHLGRVSPSLSYELGNFKFVAGYGFMMAGYRDNKSSAVHFVMNHTATLTSLCRF